MVSTSQAEAANGPTHATESPRRRKSSPSSPRHFVSVIPVFTTTRHGIGDLYHSNQGGSLTRARG